jgi:uncharacterized membrane protein
MERRFFLSVLSTGVFLPISGCILNEDDDDAILEEITIINKTKDPILIFIKIKYNSEQVYRSEIEISASEGPLTLSEGWSKEPGEYNIIINNINTDSNENIIVKSGGCLGLIVEIDEKNIAFFGPGKEECG